MQFPFITYGAINDSKLTNTNIEEIYEYASERSERDFRASLENFCIFTF